MDQNLHSLLSFIVTISLVVIVHELGHFAVAKIFKVSIEKFSVGFGKILYKKQIGLTEFSLRIIPLGGFVKFYDKAKSKDLNLFESISLFKRSLIVLAGPLINFIFAFLLLLFLNQGEQYNVLPKITAVKLKSIASEVGFQKNDLIISINDKKINSVTDHNKALIELANKNLNYTLLRNNGEILITINKARRLDLKSINANREDANGLYFFPAEESSLLVDEVVPGSIAEIANIKKGDRIFSVDNKVIYNVSGFVDSIKSKANTAILIKLFRGGEPLSISLIPSLSREGIKDIGVIGVKIKASLDNKENYTMSE